MDPDNTQSGSSTRSKIKAGLKAAGSSLSESGREEMDRASEMSARPVAYRKGGKVQRTGMAKVHRGERVIPRSKVKRVEKMMRKGKMRMKASGRR